MMSERHEKGSAEAATSPSRGSNNPNQESAVNEANDTTAPRAPASAEMQRFLNLEGMIADAYQFAKLAEYVGDAVLSSGFKSESGTHRTFTESELDIALFAMNQAKIAAYRTREAFYAAAEARS